ncbi:MAG: 4Fe-4S binding protein [Candidatus Diapherotrites archaeon]|uniref:4Fe-4S binding protein n=1 Tax=Candidatus Iainarchaeum sp. TaxID=3101447 RepID=A0A8T4LB04_9ARCH|nr:4Fe-4S binding protein [Candidatus Diapherotrites archaeon]
MLIPLSKPGTTTDIKTGKWKTHRPTVDPKLCTKCAICQNFCPEGIMGTPREIPVIDYDYCKGCSMCMVECPFKAITMVAEKQEL